VFGEKVDVCFGEKVAVFVVFVCLFGFVLFLNETMEQLQSCFLGRIGRDAGFGMRGTCV
jgi:hypothetical protein